MANNIHPVFKTILDAVTGGESLLDTYKHLLKTHDWSYNYSDSFEVYDKGRKQRKALIAMQEGLDPHFKLWNEIAPANYRIAVKADVVKS